jgi:hypothetical protein
MSGKDISKAQPLTQEQVNALKANMSLAQKRAFDDAHLCVRETINHPNINGPFDTGWGYTDFDGAGFADKIGLPDLPGQTTMLNR